MSDSPAPLLRKGRVYAQRLLRYRPRSTQEMARRLQCRGYPSAVIQAIIADLTAAGALNDRQFAVLWARSRAHHLRGSRRIAQELQQHGVAEPLIDETMRVLAREHDEASAARAFVERRLPRYHLEPPQARWRKLSQQLARRGFSSDIIEDALHQCLPSHDQMPR